MYNVHVVNILLSWAQIHKQSYDNFTTILDLWMILS